MDLTLDGSVESSGQADDVDNVCYEQQEFWNHSVLVELSEFSEIACRCGSSGFRDTRCFVND